MKQDKITREDITAVRALLDDNLKKIVSGALTGRGVRSSYHRRGYTVSFELMKLRSDFYTVKARYPNAEWDAKFSQEIDSLQAQLSALSQQKAFKRLLDVSRRGHS